MAKNAPFVSMIMLQLIRSASLPLLIAATTPPSQPATTAFSATEESMHGRVWNVIQSSCSGCWSGCMRVYTVSQGTSGGSLVDTPHNKDPPNFRLEVRTDRTTGTWSVFNLNTEGDHFVIPLAKTPATRSSQLKIGFDEGIVLRVPCEISPELKRIVFEVGFWDPSSMRRTCVVEYSRPLLLRDISVIQMKPENPKRFVGNSTDPDAVRILPLEAPFSLQECQWKSFKLCRSECVDMQTMEQTRLRSSDESFRAVEERIKSLFLDQDKHRFRRVLPNRMLVSIPIRLRRKGTPMRAMFAHFLDGSKKILVVEVVYDDLSAKAKTIYLHSLRQRR